MKLMRTKWCQFLGPLGRPTQRPSSKRYKLISKLSQNENCFFTFQWNQIFYFRQQFKTCICLWCIC